MRASQLCAMLDNMADSTLRKLATDYADYLSPSATGDGRKHRDYTDHDARVLKLVHDMKRANQSEADIEVTLASLQAGAWERLPRLDEQTSAIIPSPAAMIESQRERAVLQREIELLRERIAELNASQADREQLIRQLVAAETELRLIKSGWRPPSSEG